MEYKCEMCGLVFTSEWSDEDAKKEAEMYFGKHPDEWKDEKVFVCDDCFTQMFPPMHPELVKESKKYL